MMRQRLHTPASRALGRGQSRSRWAKTEQQGSAELATAAAANDDDAADLIPTADEIALLEGRTMLRAATQLARQHNGTMRGLWRHAYGRAQPRRAVEKASVWFTAYPASMIGPRGATVLEVLGDESLWRAFADLGIEGMHTGPVKRAGGLCGTRYTGTVDGHFDRIEMAVDPAFGDEHSYRNLVEIAANHGGTIIGDIIPAHTGKGADFRLAERNHDDYPGLYHMVSIAPADWGLLPDVPEGDDSTNLNPDTVDELAARGYVIGRLKRVIFYEPGVKESNWSVTRPVAGVDGVVRRWVYLHFFKAGQPALNWVDPTAAAQRLVLGDVLHSLSRLGAGMLRLDANGFLGLEASGSGTAWSEGHPLSTASNHLIAGFTRKMGGFTFQELNLTLEDIREGAQTGADLSYDFVTRPAYHHAMATGDASFLTLMMHEMHGYGIDPAGLVHALQNHDELTLELVHFWDAHRADTYSFRGEEIPGEQLRRIIINEMHARLIGPHAPYNHLAQNGIACTSVSVVAAALGIADLSTDIGAGDIERIKQAHLLLAMFNAMQPGVFAVSGWDLVGAVTLAPQEVTERLGDGDTRWLNRGAYDLLDSEPDAAVSSEGMPRARALYGSLSAQLADPGSFAARLRTMLAVRRELCLATATQRAPLCVSATGMLVLVHDLPEDLGWAVTALNFATDAVSESVRLPADIPRAQCRVVVGEPAVAAWGDCGNSLMLKLPPHAGCVVHIRRA